MFLFRCDKFSFDSMHKYLKKRIYLISLKMKGLWLKYQSKQKSIRMCDLFYNKICF